jgi:sugar/nucleoside kinase (ribokinase family)
VVAVAGEALVDFVPAGRPGLFEAAPGGSPANVAVGLTRLQVRSGCSPGSPMTGTQGVVWPSIT